MAQNLETKFNSNELWYGNRSEWTYTDLQYGVITTSDTPAEGFIAAGSQIPGGRFVVPHPDDMTKTDRARKRCILPDQEGFLLIQLDGTDYSSIIENSKVDSEFIFAGVSVVQPCKPKVCELAQAVYDNTNNNDTVVDPYLQTFSQFITPQPKPIGYESPESRSNYWNFNTEMSVVNNDRVTVYAETDFNLGDQVYVRTMVSDPNAAIDQLIGGVSNIVDEGLQGIPNFDVRVVKPCVAGSAVELQLL